MSTTPWAPKIRKFNEEEERDDHGRWTHGENALPSFKDITKNMTRVKDGPLGSNGGRWYQSSDGKMYLIKPAGTAAHAYNEVAAGAVYREAGTPFPRTSVAQSPSGKNYIISEKVDGVEQKTGAWWDAHPEAQAAAVKDFGTDALLSHWDALGLGADNTLISGDGTPVRIESGGAMMFRAMGEPKIAFSPGVSWAEPNTLRTSAQGQTLYGKMTDAQAADSLEAAGKIDLSAVQDRWNQIGVPPLMSATWMQTLEARQAQIPALVASLRGTSKLWQPAIRKFDESEERDDHGRWAKAAAGDLKPGDVIHAGGVDHTVISVADHPASGFKNLKYDDGGGPKEMLVPKEAVYDVTHAPPPPPPPEQSATVAQDFMNSVHSGNIVNGEMNRAELTAVTRGMTKEQLKYVNSYKNGSSSINAYLRKGNYGSASEPSYEKYADTLQAGLERRIGSDKQQTFVVNRGADALSLHLNGEPYKNHITADEIKPGMIFRDPGFQSTSIGKGFELGIRWHLTVPPDVPAAYVGVTDGFKGEREVILGKGLAMVCTAVQKDSAGITHLFATVVPPALDDAVTGGAEPGVGSSTIPIGTLDTFTPRHVRMLTRRQRIQKLKS